MIENKQDPKKKLRELCGNYYDAVVVALDYLFEEDRKKFVGNVRITEIITSSFGFGERYAQHIVQCYLGNMHKVKSQRKCEFDFSISSFDALCEERVRSSGKRSIVDRKIVVPKSVKEEILRLSNKNLNIPQILVAATDKGEYWDCGGICVSKDFRKEIESLLAEFDEAFDTFPNLRYWKLYFEYIFPLRKRYLLTDDTRFISRMEEDKVSQLLKALDGAAPHKTPDAYEEAEKLLKPLLKYAEELEMMGMGDYPRMTQEDKIELFSNVSAEELCIHHGWEVQYLKAIAKFRLRPVDVRLMYRLGTLYNYQDQETFLNEHIIDKLREEENR